MNLTPLLVPTSVALIGASNREGSFGYDMVSMLIKGAYKGEIYPINPRYSEVCGVKCYSDFNSIGHPVDLAVLCVNAARVEEQAKLCIDAGVKALIVFANCILEEEKNSESQLEDRLITLCREHNVLMLGHNAMGYYNNDIGLRISSAEAPDVGVKGNIAFLSQSGSTFLAVAHNEPQLKFNLVVSVGTGQIVGVEDYIIFALEQPTTKVVCVYMESVRKPERFIEAMEIAAKTRIPIVLIKVGKSVRGAEFARSHTGGLAGDDDAFQAIFDHYGVIRCNNLCEMANTLMLFSLYPDIPKGSVVAVADSGGERNMLADLADEVGLDFAKLSDDTMTSLAAIQEFPQEADNPLDCWGTGREFERIFEESLMVMLSDPGAAIGVISEDLRDDYYVSQGCVEALRSVVQKQHKPAVFLTNFSGTRRNEMTSRIQDYGSCLLMESREAFAGIRNWFKFRDFKFANANVEQLSLPAEFITILRSKGTLQEKESLSVLGVLGINTLSAFELAGDADLEAHKNKYVYPAVLKTAATGILHKADVDGVKLNIKNYEELVAAYEDMSARLGKEAIVVPMFTYDTELIFGMKKDPMFGPLIIVGAGGIYTEMMRDRIILHPAATGDEILEKLSTLKTYKLLTGFRGSVPADINLLVAQIKRFCAVAAYLSEWVSEIDINPVAVAGEKIVALDALMIFKNDDKLTGLTGVGQEQHP